MPAVGDLADALKMYGLIVSSLSLLLHAVKFSWDWYLRSVLRVRLITSITRDLQITGMSIY